MFANSQRGKDSEPYTAEDFMYGTDGKTLQESDEPVLLDDPVAQSNLIRATMFGLSPATCGSMESPNNNDGEST